MSAFSCYAEQVDIALAVSGFDCANLNGYSVSNVYVEGDVQVYNNGNAVGGKTSLMETTPGLSLMVY